MRGGDWERAVLPVDPVDITLTEVAVTEDTLVLGGAKLANGWASPLVVVATQD
jgi:hypothetical protein